MVDSPRRQQPKSGWRAVFGMLVIMAVLLPLIVVLGSGWYIRSSANASEDQHTDAIVVLGAAQFDGTPSPVLHARLNHALSLYQQGIAPRVITVGGKQTGDRYTEARVGRDWLIQHGVPANSVFAVEDGDNTVDSMVDVGRLAAANGWTSITLDSDPAHMGRSRAIANRLGFDAYTNPTHDDDGSAVTNDYVARETLAYLAFELRDQWDVPRLVRP